MRADGGLWVPGALAPGTPTAGNVIYPKSDGMWYTKDSAGVEVLVGSKLVPTPSATTDAANKAYVDSQVTAVAAVGQQLAVAKRFTTYAITNTTLWSTATAAIIASLNITVTGNGRPTFLEFRCPYFINSTGTNLNLQAWFVITTPATGGTSTAYELLTVPAVGITGSGFSLTSTQNFTNGSTYKIEVGISTAVSSGNTITLQAGQIPTWTVDWPMTLEAVRR